MTLYPNDTRANNAQKVISDLRHEQARGNLEVAKFYEKYHRWRGALVYYNEVVGLTLTEPNSPYAVEARKRIESLTKMVEKGK